MKGLILMKGLKVRVFNEEEEVLTVKKFKGGTGLRRMPEIKIFFSYLFIY
jgi:hypothetical protein